MANIFAGTELPAWLQERNRVNTEHGQWGQLAGTLAGGLLNGLGRDPNAAPDPETGEQPRKGFGQGLFEARMNQQDPMWKLKASQLQSNITTQAVHAEAAHALAQERIAENQGILHDLPSISGMASIPAARWNDEAVTPPEGGWQSKWGVETFDKLAQQKATERIAIDRSKSAIEYADRLTEFDTTLYTNPILKSQVATLPNGGMIPTPDGKSVPSPDAWSMVNQFRVSTGLPPIGASKSTVAAIAQQQRAKDALSLEAEKQKGKVALQGLKSQSPLGKLFQDRAAAVARGASPEELSAYDAKLSSEKGMPQQIQLKNGEWATWMPGATTMHVLKDPRREAEAKVAYDKFRAALQIEKDYRVAEATGKINSTADAKYALKKDVSDRVKDIRKLQENYESFLKPTKEPVPTEVQQVDGPMNTDQQQQTPRVRKYNPATGEIE